MRTTFSRKKHPYFIRARNSIERMCGIARYILLLGKVPPLPPPQELFSFFKPSQSHLYFSLLVPRINIRRTAFHLLEILWNFVLHGNNVLSYKKYQKSLCVNVKTFYFQKENFYVKCKIFFFKNNYSLLLMVLTRNCIIFNSIDMWRDNEYNSSFIDKNFRWIQEA